MSGFEELDLTDDLVERLHAQGYRRPTVLQADAVPVVARGTNAVGQASSGSGKTLAYGLGLMTRLGAGATATRALVLRPTDDAAAATAESLQRLAAPALDVRALRPGRPREAVAGDITVSSPGAALAAIERSAIKLGELETLVVDGVSSIVDLGASDALETVSAQIPREAQRVVLSSETTAAVQDWIERHARPARRLIDPTANADPLPESAAECFSDRRGAWLPVLCALLDQMAAKGQRRTVVFCRRTTEIGALTRSLKVRNFDADGSTDSGAVEIAGELEPGRDGSEMCVFWGAPADALGFRQRVAEAVRTVVFAETGELPHLRRIAATLGARLAPLRTGVAPETLKSVQGTRDDILEAARTRDLEPYLLLLEPLFETLGSAPVAAAATWLLRERAPVAPPAPSLPAWTRLYFAVGRRDGVRPADIVGAITGEAPVTGDQVGRIDIRDTHSLVEVAAETADQVLKHLATTTIRGRPVNVRLFRE